MPGTSVSALLSEYLTVGVAAPATVTQSSLTSGSDTGAKASYQTATVSPGAYRLILLAVVAGQNAPTLTSASGCGLTFEHVGDQNIMAGPAEGGSRRVHLWRAMSTSTSSGVITINFSQAVTGGITWSLSEFSGVDVSGTNGAGAIGQVLTWGSERSDPAVSSIDVDFEEDFDANNAVFGVCGVNHDSDDAIAAGTGYNVIHDRRLSGERPAHLQTQWRQTITPS